MTEQVRLNIGSGSEADVLGEWTNVDVIPGDGVDVVADCRHLPYEDESVDAIRSSHMVEHLTKPELTEFAAECFRVLRPGGQLEVLAPALDRFVEAYYERRNQESIDLENVSISPIDWLDNALFARHLHETDFHKQGIYGAKLLRTFNQFTSHHVQPQDRPCSLYEILMTCEKPPIVRCSVVFSTRNKAKQLELTLESIFCQEVPFPFEVIVVDDGSTDQTRQVCSRYPVQYHHLENPRYRNPSIARNVGYRAARGEVIIAQSDDIIHRSPNTIQFLVEDLSPGEFLLAQVQNYRYQDGQPVQHIMEYCGPRTQRPYFFLGSLLRSDLYRAGGSDPEFVEPCFDDNWFADCLIKGLKLKARYTNQVEGHHQSHVHGETTHLNEHLSRALYTRKKRVAKRTRIYQSSTGPWPTDNPPDHTHRVILTAPVAKAAPTLLAAIPSIDPDDPPGKIPRVMNFFWSGPRLSWMRYLTLRSFRYYNPDFRIVLHTAEATGGKKWVSSETLDSQSYEGPDYMDQVDALDVTRKTYDTIHLGRLAKGLAPSHLCDICQWQLLHHDGGFYADMDILFAAPIPYDDVKNRDVVYCLSEGFIAIGLFGASPQNRFFKAVLETAKQNYKPTAYQSTGAEAIYRLGGIWPRWGQVDQPGIKALQTLKLRFQKEKFLRLPDSTVYPWTYRQTEQIFNETHLLPPGCIGIHWFGGNTISQQWNNLLTVDNQMSYSNTFIQCAKGLL